MSEDEEYVRSVKAAVKKAWADADEYTRARGFTWGEIATAMGQEVDTYGEEVHDISRVLHDLVKRRHLTIDRTTQPHRFKPRRRTKAPDE